MFSRAPAIKFDAELVENCIELKLFIVIEHREHVSGGNGSPLRDFGCLRPPGIGEVELHCPAIRARLTPLDKLTLLELPQQLTDSLRPDAKQEGQVFLVYALF